MPNATKGAVTLTLVTLLAEAEKSPEDPQHQRRVAEKLRVYVSSNPDHEKVLSEILEEDPETDLKYRRLISFLG